MTGKEWSKRGRRDYTKIGSRKGALNFKWGGRNIGKGEAL